MTSARYWRWRCGSQLRWPTDNFESALDHERFQRFYETKYSEIPPSRMEDRDAYQTILGNLALIDSGRVTVAGLLLLGKRLPILLPEMKIDAIWFQGTERAASYWHDQATITGTLADQYEEAMGFLKRWNVRHQREGSLYPFRGCEGSEQTLSPLYP